MTTRRRVHGVLVAALLVSVAANVSGADPTWLGRCVAAWPPIALMLVVDVLGRVSAGSGWLGRCQVLGAGGVALVAAVASFAHMQSVARDAGESELVAWLFPLTVDGLAVVCSVALVELDRRSKVSDPAPMALAVPAPLDAAAAVVVEQGPVPEYALNGHGPPVKWL